MTGWSESRQAWVAWLASTGRNTTAPSRTREARRQNEEGSPKQAPTAITRLNLECSVEDVIRGAGRPPSNNVAQLDLTKFRSNSLVVFTASVAVARGSSGFDTIFG